MIYKKYNFSFDQHRGKDVILLRFENNLDLRKAPRFRFPSAKWSSTKKSWYLPDLPVLRDKLNLQEKTDGKKRWTV